MREGGFCRTDDSSACCSARGLRRLEAEQAVEELRADGGGGSRELAALVTAARGQDGTDGVPPALRLQCGGQRAGGPGPGRR